MGQGNTLSAILRAGDLRNGLCGDIAGRGKTLRFVDHRLADDRAVLQHVLQIDKTAIVHMLCKIVRIMEMDNTLFMGFHNICRQQKSFCNIFADFPRHIIPLYAVHRGILIGVFLFYFFVAALEQA